MIATTMVAYALQTPHPSPGRAVLGLYMVSIPALGISYAVALVAAVPAHLVLARLGWTHLLAYLVVGTVLGAAPFGLPLLSLGSGKSAADSAGQRLRVSLLGVLLVPRYSPDQKRCRSLKDAASRFIGNA
jgi:hypothetical protein